MRKRFRKIIYEKFFSPNKEISEETRHSIHVDVITTEKNIHRYVENSRALFLCFYVWTPFNDSLSYSLGSRYS